MKMKVICAVMIYNGETYHEGDDVEVDDEKERQMLIRERCAVQSEVIEKEVDKFPEDASMNKEQARQKGGRRR